MNPDDVELYQFMGKDSKPRFQDCTIESRRIDVYFHTVLFPAMLLADGRNWTMLHNISSTRKSAHERADRRIPQL